MSYIDSHDHKLVGFNVLILPPAYKAPGGRSRNAAGKVIWGNHRWATQKKKPDSQVASLTSSATKVI